MIESSEREQQRFRHLVLGRPRPKAPKPSKRSRRRHVPAIELAPDIARAITLREDWSHKAGTPETHGHALAERMRELDALELDPGSIRGRAFQQLGRCGALARLHQSEAIDAHQLAAGVEIATAFAATVADVAVRTAKWGQRGSVSHGGAEAERMGAIVLDRAYTRWREAVGPHGAMLLAIIVDDMALTAAARRWRLSNRRARAVLVDALDRWRRG